MFGWLGLFVVRRAWWVIGGWLVVALGIIATAPALADITSADQGSFLPESYESVQAIELGKKAFPKQNISTAIIVVKRSDGQPLTSADETNIGKTAQDLGAKNIAATTGYVTGPPAVAPDRSIQIINVGLQAPAPDDPALLDAVRQIRTELNAAMAGSGLTAGVAGDVASYVSNEAMAMVRGELRDALHAAAPEGVRALVGGTTAIFADINTANNRDLSVILPAAALLIGLVLALLLRSLVAPIYLVIAVLLNFAATLGAAVYVFEGLQDKPGVTFQLPIILYLFVVAIGTDYNILMIARLREEAREGNRPRVAAAIGVEHAGPTVAAAGVILAGTFAVLMLAPISFMQQLGFAVALGIVLSAFLMSMFLRPRAHGVARTRRLVARARRCGTGQPADHARKGSRALTSSRSPYLTTPLTAPAPRSQHR